MRVRGFRVEPRQELSNKFRLALVSFSRGVEFPSKFVLESRYFGSRIDSLDDVVGEVPGDVSRRAGLLQVKPLLLEAEVLNDDN